jgi:hypothetical protein
MALGELPSSLLDGVAEWAKDQSQQADGYRKADELAAQVRRVLDARADGRLADPSDEAEPVGVAGDAAPSLALGDDPPRRRVAQQEGR